MNLRQDVDEFDDLDDSSDFLKSGKLSLSGYSQVVDEAKIFAQKVQSLAKTHMLGFFKDKLLHTGGKVSKSVLLTAKRISKVVNYTIIMGVESAYDAIGDSLPEDEDIGLVIETLHKIGRYRHDNGSSIPIEFRGGLLCVYLELVEGYKF